MKAKFVLISALLSSAVSMKAQVNSYDSFLGDSIKCDYYAQIFFDSSFKVSYASLNIQRDISRSIKNKLRSASENSVTKLRHNEEFQLWILEKISENYNLGGFAVRIFELERPMTDYDIRCASDALPFTPDEFAVTAIKMLATQQEGEDGTLRTDGPINVFYVRISSE